MDNEMIERVIKASFDCWAKNKRSQLALTVEHLSSSEYEFAVEHAKAIIKAMREPTEAMVGAIIKKNGFLPNGRFWAEVWNDGIDAVIND